MAITSYAFFAFIAFGASAAAFFAPFFAMLSNTGELERYLWECKCHSRLASLIEPDQTTSMHYSVHVGLTINDIVTHCRDSYMIITSTDEHGLEQKESVLSIWVGNRTRVEFLWLDTSPYLVRMKQTASTGALEAPLALFRPKFRNCYCNLMNQ